MPSSVIPLTFIVERLQLSWQQALFGIEQGWLDPRAAIELAVQRVTADDSTDENLIELAGLMRGEEGHVVATLQRLASKENAKDEQQLRLIWMRLILAWLLETKEQYDDPLWIVEGVYADFGYPEEIRSLIRHNNSGGSNRLPDNCTQQEIIVHFM